MNSFYGILILCFGAFAVSKSASSKDLTLGVGQVLGEPPLRTIKNGEIQGKWQLSRGGRAFGSFEGIPYAQPPKRFQAPLSPENWKGTYDAAYPRDICAQIENLADKAISASEDCLYINVYVPELYQPTGLLLPVMFWIHGGDFNYGSGSEFGPKYFMDEDVILVTFNYRLGALGFLSTGDSLVSGNMAYKDMLRALKWVRFNIEFFGGNSQDVTIFGESAGGTAVHALSMSTVAKGLFSKVISQSGTIFGPDKVNWDPLEQVKILASRLKCSGSSPEEMVECLVKADPVTLMKEGNSLQFSTVIDATPKEGDFSVFPEPMEDLATRADSFPMMIGRNQHEWLITAEMLFNTTIVDKFNADYRKLLPEIMDFSPFLWENDTKNRVSDEIHKFYFGGLNITDKKEGILKLEKAISDFRVNWNVKTAAITGARAKCTVFPYLFHFNGSYSMVHRFNVTSEGPTHGDELQYLFQSLNASIMSWPDLNTSRDVTFSKNLVKMWASFAATGVPSRDSRWEPIDRAQVEESDDVPLFVFILDEQGKFISEEEIPESVERIKFWNNVFQYEKNQDNAALALSLHISALLAIAIAVLQP